MQISKIGLTFKVLPKPFKVILFIIKRTCFQVKNIENHPLKETSQTTKSEEYYLPHSQNYDGISQHRNQKHLNKYLQEDCGYVSP